MSRDLYARLRFLVLYTIATLCLGLCLGWLLYYTGVRDLVSVVQPPPKHDAYKACQLPASPFVQIDIDFCQKFRPTLLSQPTHFAVPMGTPLAGQTFIVTLAATTRQPITFATDVDGGFSEEAGLPLPRTIPPDTLQIYGFEWKDTIERWVLIGVIEVREP